MSHDHQGSHEFDEFLTTEEMEATRPRDVDDEMDLTPMVDVTFLLLIFFMITAAFAASKAINVPPVSDDAAQNQVVDDPELDMITVRIDADNVYWIAAPAWPDEQRAMSAAAMRDKLREARTDGPKPPNKLLVQAHGDSRHESVVAALDGGAGAGCEEIALMSYEDGDLDF
ncbi:MAG: biopolymer transporter ExbD [Pirellulales bacterium]|nr:biopolymer transporter ExbD [Pirellulales bacterium]MBX3434044.1 biopolymer transporter ExbD [Pirellulales bacterium]